MDQRQVLLKCIRFLSSFIVNPSSSPTVTCQRLLDLLRHEDRRLEVLGLEKALEPASPDTPGLEPLVASLLLAVRPGAPSSVLAPGSVLAPSSDARSP